MGLLIYLIPIALLLGLAGLVAFLWSLRSGQYEDLDGAANRILFDDGDPLDGTEDGAGDGDARAGRSDPARRAGSADRYQ